MADGLAEDLASKKCIPCMGGVPPLKGIELADLYAQLGKEWAIVNGHHIEKEFHLPSFKESLAFVQKIGDLAEEQGHHPILVLDFRKVRLTLWTHKIDGLAESDFIFAAKADRLFSG